MISLKGWLPIVAGIAKSKQQCLRALESLGCFVDTILRPMTFNYPSVVYFLEVLLAPNEVERRVRIHVAFDMQRTTKTLWTTEEHASFCRSMNFADRTENGIPIGTTKIGWRAKTRKGIHFGVGIVDHDIGSLVWLDLSSKILQAPLVFI